MTYLGRKRGLVRIGNHENIACGIMGSVARKQRRGARRYRVAVADVEVQLEKLFKKEAWRSKDLSLGLG